ncbi:MAG TPA: hypothetical protein VNW94_27190 [Streptosporangiaceae bacterium]|nr:hypothetical protein [Streptosporangiaceae bacterium]
MPPIVFFGGAAGLAILLAAVAFAVAGPTGSARSAPRQSQVADSGPTPQSYFDSPSTKVFTGIDRRSADPAPLTLDEVFPAAPLADGRTKSHLALAGKRLDNHCDQAVWGQALAADLRKAGCTQAARGLYTDPRTGYAAAITILNLDGAASANRIVHALGPQGDGGFVLPLPGPVGTGFGMARGLAMGHYAVISWVQRIDGTGDERNEALLSLLVTAGNPPSVYGRAAAHTS